MSWYQTGYNSEIDKPTKTAQRLWMPRGGEASVTIVDDDTQPFCFKYEGEEHNLMLPVILREHQMKIDGSWRNWFTCLKSSGKPCPLCFGKHRPYQAAIYTVIDHSEWEDKQGNLHKDELKLLVVKTSTPAFGMLKKESNKRGGLRGCRYDVSRQGEKAATIGDVWQFDAKTELPDKIQPFNYLEIFAPKSEEDLKMALSWSLGGDSNDSGYGSSFTPPPPKKSGYHPGSSSLPSPPDDDDIPF